MAVDVTGKKTKERVKEGDDLIPKTSFKPIAHPSKLNCMKMDSAEEISRMPRLFHEDIMRIFIASRTPIMLWGPVGSSKTRSIEAIGEETDEAGTPYQVMTIQPSTMNPSTIHGIMTTQYDPVTGRTLMIRSIPEVAEKVWNYFNNQDGLTLMFLDEMTTSIPATQNAMLGLLTHGQYGSMNIGPYVSFAMAANPEGTVSTVMPLSEAIINRSGHIPWYSEGKLWYDKWVTGFGNPAKEPPSKTKQFMKAIIEENEYAFRADPEMFDNDQEAMWHVDKLVPYGQMNFSERSADEYSKLYTTIQSSLEDVDFDIRSLYVTEIARAMLGNRSAALAERIEARLEEQVGIEPTMKMIKKYDITIDMTTEQVRNIAGDKLHRNKGRRLDAPQTKQLAEEFEEEMFAGGDIRESVYQAFWLWLTTCPDEKSRQPAIDVAAKILQKASYAVQNTKMSKEKLRPRYVPKEITDEIRSVMARAKNQSR